MAVGPDDVTHMAGKDQDALSPVTSVKIAPEASVPQA